MTALNKQALIAKIKKQTESFDTVVLQEDEANALLDELKSSENNLIDSECHVAELEEALRDKQALLEAAEERIAELEARKAKPVMFIDGDISSVDADKLAAVIREFNEETETPAARMARIIRENPRPTNMCDMPAAGIGVKGE